MQPRHKSGRFAKSQMEVDRREMQPRHKSGRFAKSQKEVDQREKASSRMSAFKKLSNVNNTLAENPCDSSVSDNLGLSVNASDCDEVNERPKYTEQAVQSVPVQPMTTPTAPKVQGHRSVELDTLSIALENGCISCLHAPLKIINITHERHFGYTSGLYIRYR